MMYLLPILVSVLPGPSIRPCFQVDGQRILMSDLARAVPAFKTLDPSLTVGLSPLPGARRVILPVELFALAHPRGIALDSPAAVCFERAAAPLSLRQLEAALRRSLGDSIQFEITDFSRYPVPPGELQFSRSGLNFPPAGNPETPVLWLGHVVYDTGRHFPAWVRVKLTTMRKVLVASRPILSGQIIDAQQIRSELRSTFPFPDVAPVDPAQAIGRIVRRSLAAGMVISNDMLSYPPAVSRGETVSVRVEDGAAHLHLTAMSQASGRIGDFIIVENPTTHVRFRGMVDAPHEVLVRSGGVH